MWGPINDFLRRYYTPLVAETGDLFGTTAAWSGSPVRKRRSCNGLCVPHWKKPKGALGTNENSCFFFFFWGVFIHNSSQKTFHTHKNAPNPYIYICICIYVYIYIYVYILFLPYIFAYFSPLFFPPRKLKP